MYAKIKLSELKQMFPNLTIYWSYHKMPKNLCSETYLRRKGKWSDKLKPVGVKGGALTTKGYFFLYEEP